MSAPSAVAAPASPQPRGESWSRNRFVFFIALAFALHVALIFVFGTKKQIVPREADSGATNVPHLHLADNANELIALGDPTLFARPNAHDFAAVFWRRTPAVAPPDLGGSAAPCYLAPAPENFGALFRQFMQASRPAPFALDLKPEPKLFEPMAADDEAMPQATTWQITGDLTERRLLTPAEPPVMALNNVVAPSRVRVLVDTAGNVASAVLLPLDSAAEEAGRSETADAQALAFVRWLRFVPAPQLTFGEIVFRWHTVPATPKKAP